ncbi:hypothetical protein HMI54_010692 [Coelomomyces lativittatus]|nr:hypothetical protein HMI56_005076 [Coelomomyces lativittatus]KAJ1516152.1 hypothetical protein HMI54_010692 [Coelomomyces lativittatus]
MDIHPKPFFHFDPHVESISDFLHRLKPSKTTNVACFWISIHNGVLASYPTSFFTPSKSILENFRQESIPILEKGKSLYMKSSQYLRPIIIEETKTKLLSLATQFKITSGKWILFFNESIVDLAWSKIVHATHEGVLGSSAKVSPKAHQTSVSYLVCVYTEDFNDKKEIGRVLYELRRLFPSLHKTSIYYKPDCYTSLGLYYNNTSKLPASIYKSTQFDANGLFTPTVENPSSSSSLTLVNLSSQTSPSSFPISNPSSSVAPSSHSKIAYITLEEAMEASPPNSPIKFSKLNSKKRSGQSSNFTNLLYFNSPPISPTTSLPNTSS